MSIRPARQALSWPRTRLWLCWLFRVWLRFVSSLPIWFLSGVTQKRLAPWTTVALGSVSPPQCRLVRLPLCQRLPGVDMPPGPSAPQPCSAWAGRRGHPQSF